MKKLVAAFGGAITAVSIAACGGHKPVATATGGSSGSITQSAVSPLGAHFPGRVTADQFVCWDSQVSPPGTPGTATGNVSVDQWELSHLGGKLSDWLVKNIRAVQQHPNNVQDLSQLARDCKAKVPLPPGWTDEGPKQSG